MKNDSFSIKYVLPTIATLLTLVVMSQFYMTTLKENDLQTITGKITSIVQDKYRHYKNTDDRITIRLANSSRAFYFFDNREKFFPTIMSALKVGDTVTLMHRTKLQSLIGSGSQFNLMGIQKGQDILYPVDKALETFNNVGWFGLYTTPLLWVFYFFMRRKLKKQEGSK